MRGGRDDEGSGTVLGVALVMLVGVLLMAISVAGGLFISQTRARAAADLAAVSAATALLEGRSVCYATSSVDEGSGVGLEVCTFQDGDFFVWVSVSTRIPLAPQVVRSAQAGPVPCG